MRVVANIPTELVQEVREAVERGDYESPEEFLEQALRTQLELETGGDEPVMSFSEAVQGEQAAEPEQATLGKTETATGTEETDPETTSSPDLSDLSHTGDEFEIETVSPPANERIDRGPLWGQYNRIFPMKVTLRRLALVLQEEDLRGVPYEEFRNETARVARAYGLRLVEADEEMGRGRGEKFSAAFPTGDKVERSLERFETHFVGQMDSSGSLTGAPPTLKFLNVHPDAREFGITEAGREFAQLENPLLDNGLNRDKSLSESERRYYIGYVADEHPAEYGAMQAVVEAILEGVNRPDPLSERVGQLTDEWSEAQASTVRSGLIGRMYELGLVTRERVGARGIGYEVTDRAKDEFL